MNISIPCFQKVKTCLIINKKIVRKKINGNANNNIISEVNINILFVANIVEFIHLIILFIILFIDVLVIANECINQLIYLT